MSEAAAVAAPAGGVRRIGSIIVGLIGIGVVALIFAGLMAVRTLGNSETNTRQVLHTLEVERAIDRLGIQVETSETARRGFLLSLQPRLATIAREAIAQANRESDALVVLVGDNPEQLQRAQALQEGISALGTLQITSLEAVERGEAEWAQNLFRTDASTDTLIRLREQRAELSNAEAGLLQQRNATRAEGLARFYTILAVCAFLVFAIVGTAIIVIRRYTRELARSRDALHALNSDLEGLVGERTTELQRANEEIQRFAYIVSHDLRSPLVNVMGFTSELEAAREPLAKLVATVDAEAPGLMTIDARRAIDEDLPEAARFIRASTEKMDRLINAILRLSREGRRGLASEKIDMTALAAASADTLHQLAANAGARIMVEPLPDIVSDRVAIDQIFSNLIENGIKYLRADVPGIVTIRGRRAGRNRVVYEIADNGRGIDPRDHQRIFDLFRRSGAQDRPGEGIGLAHVRSLVWRLGGTIEVDSALDEGATFRLSLPDHFSDATGA